MGRVGLIIENSTSKWRKETRLCVIVSKWVEGAQMVLTQEEEFSGRDRFRSSPPPYSAGVIET